MDVSGGIKLKLTGKGRGVRNGLISLSGYEKVSRFFEM
jgi:hypothetical protein